MGTPCKYGHSGKRFVKGGKFVECNVERTRKFREKANTGKVTKSKAVMPTGPTASVLTLAQRVKVLVEKGDKAAEKAEQFYKSAGIHIKEIKEQSEDWEAIVREKCGLGRSRAYELMAIADGTTTLEKVRDRSNRSSKISHAKKSAVQRMANQSPIIESEVTEVTPPPEIEAAREPDAFTYTLTATLHDTDDEPTLADKIIMVIGKERAALLIVELQKLLGATSEAA